MDDSIESRDLSSPQSRKKREHVTNGREKSIKETSKQKQRHDAQKNRK